MYQNWASMGRMLLASGSMLLALGWYWSISGTLWSVYEERPSDQRQLDINPTLSHWTDVYIVDMKAFAI